MAPGITHCRPLRSGPLLLLVLLLPWNLNPAPGGHAWVWGGLFLSALGMDSAVCLSPRVPFPDPSGASGFPGSLRPLSHARRLPAGHPQAPHLLLIQQPDRTGLRRQRRGEGRGRELVSLSRGSHEVSGRSHRRGEAVKGTE